MILLDFVCVDQVMNNSKQENRYIWKQWYWLKGCFCNILFPFVPISIFCYSEKYINFIKVHNRIYLSNDSIRELQFVIFPRQFVPNVGSVNIDNDCAAFVHFASLWEYVFEENTYALLIYILQHENKFCNICLNMANILFKIAFYPMIATYI